MGGVGEGSHRNTSDGETNYGNSKQDLARGSESKYGVNNECNSEDEVLGYSQGL